MLMLVKKLSLSISIATLVFVIGYGSAPSQQAHATPTPGEISSRITELTGLSPEEIDQMYAAEQAASLVLINYDISIPILLEDRIGYLLIRIAATGEWIRMIVPTIDEWDDDFRPYLESQGVTIHKQPYDTITDITPAAEAAAIAASGSIPGTANANLILYGDLAGPSGTIPTPASPAGPSVPPLSSYPGIDSIGTTAGNFRVDESGAASYSVPIATAAGTSGVAPQITLNYSSSAGNGIAGQGWSIGGLSAISRCRQTYDQDRNVTAITFSASDRYCLDGQRLVKTSGTYGAAGSTYRTEIDSGAIVTALGTSSGEPDYFKVERKDGSTSYYGKAPGDADLSAKLGDGPGRTLTWSIRVFSDSVAPNADEIGNPIWFFYETSGGGQRISEIRWAYGTGRGPTGHAAHMVFDYGTTARPDPIAGFIDGALFFNDKRLSAVRSYNTGTLIREYKFDYTDGIAGYDKLSRLISVEECVGSSCLPKTVLDWRNPSTFSVVQSHATFSMGNDVAAFRPADINGDGQMDLVWLRGGGDSKGLRVALSTGSGYVNTAFASGSLVLTVPSSSWSPQLEVIDYNLDGRQDVMFYDGVAGLWKLVLAEPHGDGDWRLMSSIITTPLTNRYTSFIDIDSNGTTDAVYNGGEFSRDLYVRYLELDPAEAPGAGEPDDSYHRYHFGDQLPLSGSGNDTTIGNPDSVAPDFNGDGQVDIVARGSWQACSTYCPTINNNYALTVNGAASGSPAVAPYFELATVIEAEVADPNADGLSDLFYRIGSGSPDEFKVLINKGDGTFATQSIVDTTLTNQHAQRQFVDWNMDGYVDLLWRKKVGSSMTDINVRYWDPGSGTHGAFGPTTQVASLSGWSDIESVAVFDVNGDAAADIVRINKNGTVGSVEVLTRKWSGVLQNVAVNRIERITNGLGAATHIEYEPLSTSEHYERLEVTSTTGTATFCEPTGESPPYEEVCYDAPVQVANKSAFYAEINGDWSYPQAWQSLGKNSPIIEFSGPMYVVTRVTGDAPKAGATRGSILTTATSSIEYYYGEAKIQAAGRGFLGFQRLTTVDLQSDVVTATRYRQDWPFIGLPISTQVVATDGTSFDGDTVSTSTNEWEVVEWTGSTASTAATSGTAALGPIHLVQTRSSDKAYDLVDVGALLSDVTTVSAYNGEGYPTSIKVETRDLDGLLKTITTTNKYDAPGFTAFEGRLSWSEVDTTYETSTGTDTSTLVTTFGYHDSSAHRGLLETEMIDPGSSAGAPPTITTTHGYDDHGNRDKSSVSSGGVTRCDVETSVYDPTGRYVDTTKDCLGWITSSVAARNPFGAPTTVHTYLDTSAQAKVTTTIAHSVLGREYYRHSSDGAAVTKYLTSSLTNCPTSTVIKAVMESADGAGSQVCTDKLGREVRTLTRGFDGGWDVQDTEYDEFGRVAWKSEPYDLGGAAYWTSIAYDQLGRPTTAVLPDGSTSTTAYRFVDASDPLLAPDRPGLLTTVTNTVPDDVPQVRHEISNAAGETTDVIDNSDGRTAFVYDAQGNLISTTDAGGHVTTMTYDLLGRKRTMVDPDKGSWSYEYNGFGELIKQTDARSQVQVMDYDGLGRMTCRRDEASGGNPDCDDPATNFEGAATWTYDSAPNGLGQVASVVDAISGYQKIFTYDGKGRVSEIDTTIDGQTYSEKTTYDNYGRVYQVFDAAGDGSFTDQGVVHYYNANGYLYLVGDAIEVGGIPRTIYRQITAMNARGQVEVETLGDGVVTTDYDYYALTGRMWTIKSTATTSSYDVQDLEYQWDLRGNLKHRKEMSGSKNLTENFKYEDGMNRLTEYTVTGQAPVTMSYSADGNIKTKSDVGSAEYQYGHGPANAHPHAVAQAGGQTYDYDANGNNISGDGRTIDYTVFDKPSSMTKGSFTIEFEYGPDRARYKRTDTETGNNPTVTRYLGNVEIIDRPDGSHERKRYIAGIAIETIHFGTNTVEDYRQTHYQFRDHLGSLDVITDSSGEIVQEMSFDPWGQRRNAINWQALTSSALITFDHSITTRGFTGHEMLDEVGIVHMNGRIYDPKLGRFLQADPLIQGPTNTQSLNRYSYVLNNPLNATDPSGYLSFKDIFKFVATIVVSVVTYGAASTWAIGVYGANCTVICSLSTASLIGGFAGGAAAGFAAGVSLASFNGAGFNDALKAGAKGLFAGAVFGGVSGYFGNTWNLKRVGANGLAGGITSEVNGGRFADGAKFALATSLLTYGNFKLRRAALEDSSHNPRNIDGDSGGFFGDGTKMGGAREEINLDASVKAGSAVREPCVSTMGGCQGGVVNIDRDQRSSFFGTEYEPHSVQDKIVESFAGPHDAFRKVTGSYITEATGPYEIIGNSRHLTGVDAVIDTVKNYGLVIPAAPFAISALVDYSGVYYSVGDEIF